jgi:hypothetical protein
MAWGYGRANDFVMTGKWRAARSEAMTAVEGAARAQAGCGKKTVQSTDMTAKKGREQREAVSSKQASSK